MNRIHFTERIKNEKNHVITVYHAFFENQALKTNLSKIKLILFKNSYNNSQENVTNYF